jgi:hypothetical protein
VVAALLLTGVSACSSVSAPNEPAGAAGTAEGRQASGDFLRMLRGYGSDYEPARIPAELADRSEVVALGRLTQIREGSVLGTSRADPGRRENLTFVFAIEQRYRGNLPGGTAYVEVPKPGFDPAATFDARAPRGARALLFLSRASGATADEPVIPAPAPRPVGARLWWFTTPQGLLMELGGGVVAPLEAARPIFVLGDPEPGNLLAWVPGPKPEPRAAQRTPGSGT